MILVTVGTQGPFDRLIQAVDGWAASRRRTDVFAQIGSNAWKPEFIRWEEFMEPRPFREAFVGAELIVSHAGIGTLVAALEHGKSIAVMPRLARLREHRNDHQVATAEHFCRKHRVPVATTSEELAHALDESLRLATRELIPAPRPRLAASEDLLRSVHDFILAAR